MAQFIKTPKQIEATDLHINYSQIMLYGGSRCVSGDTILDGQTKTIREIAAIGEPVQVLTSHGYQIAEPPFKKGSCKMLTIEMESGEIVTVTPDHRFWDGSRWVRASTLSRSSQLACRSQSLPQCLPQSSSAFSLLNDIPLKNGYELKSVKTITETAVQDYFTLHVPGTEQYYANGILHHNSGKTFIAVRNIMLRALKMKSRHMIGRSTFSSVKRSIGMDTLPKVFEICFPNLIINKDYIINKTDWYVKLHNGSEIWLAGFDDKERADKILGLEFSTIFLNECTQISWDVRNTIMSRLAENSGLRLIAMYDCNPASVKHWTHTVFKEGKDPEGEAIKYFENFASLQMNPVDNLVNLPPEYIALLESMPARQRKRFLAGEFQDDIEGALWDFDMIQKANSKQIRELKKTVIAVDPAVTNNPNSDLTGIIVCSLDVNNEGVIHEDLSIKASPNEWANRVVNAYHEWGAAEIVVEVNQGGDLVQSLLHSIDPMLRIEMVRASKGKFARAEPVAALYERGLIAHEKFLPDLETEMCEYVPLNSNKSPDRLDALVWGITHLMLNNERTWFRA
ncbi:MAG: phage terminase large subunit [Candidatus Anammoxibacter sp.]